MTLTNTERPTQEAAPDLQRHVGKCIKDVDRHATVQQGCWMARALYQGAVNGEPFYAVTEGGVIQAIFPDANGEGYRKAKKHFYGRWG